MIKIAVTLAAVCAVVMTSPLPQDEDTVAIIPYNYGYEVQDPETNNFQNKAEIKTSEGDVYGSYSVLMPDGYIYTTTYNVTGDSGFISRLVKTLAQVEDIPEPRIIAEESA
ncbi:Insect cuticle protein [Trinorchestia longiramus]|nr:Insect cuticle protein [Trinorchestia longiramus]